METFVVRVFVAEDVDGFVGTVQRPGDDATTFHDAAELIRFLQATITAGWAAPQAEGVAERVPDPPSC